MTAFTSTPGSAVPGRLVPGLAAQDTDTGGWPSYWTYNFNPNPSLEVTADGYQALHGTEQVSQANSGYSGRYSLQVVTPGSIPGEGISTPVASITASTVGSASLYLYGETGVLTVQAVQNPGGQVLGAVQVQLDGSDWVRAELDGLAMSQDDDFQVIVATTTPQALTFLVDAVQYEPSSPAHPYVDGDSQYGAWTGPPGLSASYQEFQNPASLDGGMTLDGTIDVIAQGEVFVIAGLIDGEMDMSGQSHPMAAVSSPSRTVIPPAVDPGVPGLPWEIAGGGSISGTTVVSAVGALGMFGVWQTGTDPDPAMTLIGYNNAGTKNASQTATSWSRLFGTFTPPQQVLDSSGRAMWQSAAYMAAGFRIASQAVWSSSAPNAVNFAEVQVEKTPVTQQGPSAYQRPRALSAIVKPTRMNYATNPGFAANSSAGWTAIGSAAVSVVSGGYQGSYSLQVTVSGAGQGVYLTVPDLILGDTYIASAYVKAVTSNITDVEMTIGNGATSANPTGYPYGTSGYGTGPYGGIDSSSASMTTGTWAYRPWTAFQATQSTCFLSFSPVLISGGSYPATFLIDCVLIEPGEVLNPYGDGSTDGWEWELGGTPGLSRSYYYERLAPGANAVGQVLQQHIPLGLTAYAPQFAVPPTQ